jgi:hypothetical protein
MRDRRDYPERRLGRWLWVRDSRAHVQSLRAGAATAGSSNGGDAPACLRRGIATWEQVLAGRHRPLRAGSPAVLQQPRSRSREAASRGGDRRRRSTAGGRSSKACFQKRETLRKTGGAHLCRISSAPWMPRAARRSPPNGSNGSVRRQPCPSRARRKIVRARAMLRRGMNARDVEHSSVVFSSCWQARGTRSRAPYPGGRHGALPLPRKPRKYSEQMSGACRADLDRRERRVFEEYQNGYSADRATNNLQRDEELLGAGRRRNDRRRTAVLIRQRTSRRRSSNGRRTRPQERITVRQLLDPQRAGTGAGPARAEGRGAARRSNVRIRRRPCGRHRSQGAGSQYGPASFYVLV